MNPQLLQALLTAVAALPPEAQARIGAYVFREIQEAMQPPVTYTVHLRTGKANTMIAIVKTIRELTQCSLKEAKDLHDAAMAKPVEVLVTLDAHAARHARRRLLEAGAGVEMLQDRAPPVYPLQTHYAPTAAPVAVEGES